MGKPPDEARVTNLVIIGLLLDLRHRVMRMEKQMAEDTSELGVELDKLESDDTAEADAIARVEAEVADLRAKAQAGSLTGEEHQRLAALENELEAHTARLNAAADGTVAPADSSAVDRTAVDQPVAVPVDTGVDAPTVADGSANAGE